MSVLERNEFPASAVLCGDLLEQMDDIVGDEENQDPLRVELAKGVIEAIEDLHEAMGQLADFEQSIDEIMISTKPDLRLVK